MKNILLCLFLNLFVVLASVTAVTTTFTDGSGNTWKGFSERVSGSDGLNGFDGTNLFVDNGNNESIGDNFIALDLGQNLTETTISGVLNFTIPITSTAFYIAINATEGELTNFGGTGYNTFTKGYGIFYDMHNSDNIYVVDRSTNVNFNDNPGESIAFANVPFIGSGLDINFELVYGANGSFDVTFWQVGQAKPNSSTLSATGLSPVSSGTNLTFGITDEGTLQVRDLNIGGAVPEPSSLLLGALALGLVLLKKKNQFLYQVKVTVIG